MEGEPMANDDHRIDKYDNSKKWYFKTLPAGVVNFLDLFIEDRGCLPKLNLRPTDFSQGLAIIILFSPEIRKFLLIIGKTTTLNRETLWKNLPWKKSGSGDQFDVNPVIDAAKTLGGSYTGALIVFTRESELKFYVDSGDRIDGVISKRLLLSIFNKNSPLHDGAVIVNNKGRISAARCILPVSDLENLPAQFGLRHRAAIGMSETTDTLVLVVSEETGQMSVVRTGKIHHNMSIQEIRKMINDYFFEEQVPQEKSPKTKFETILEEDLISENETAEDKP